MRLVMKNKENKRVEVNKEEIAEDWCFECKDGGDLRICDYKQCLKSYHPSCVGKEESFLDSERHWACPWHSCFLCSKASYFHCYTCKHAVCRRCIRSAAFLRVRGTNGFCHPCLKLVLLINESKGYDSDGNRVDFKDRETCEGLFKEYYDIIKKDEKLELKEIYEAQDREKIEKHHQTKSSSDEYDEDGEEQVSDYDGLEPERKRRKIHGVKKSERQNSAKKTNGKSKKMEYIGWGSKPLMEFLTSFGKSTNEKLSQNEVTSIVIEYIKENNLYHPENRKVVVCDAQLLSLFKRKTIRVNRIDESLDAHFLENLDETEEDEPQEDLEKTKISCTVDASETKKKLGMEKKVQEKKKENAVPQSVFAAIVAENLKLIYLQRELLKELLKEPELFEEKVIGCFVRVKSDPKDCFSRNHFHLRQIKGVKTVTDSENKTETVLLLSATTAEFRISQLHDGNNLDEECEELRQKVQAGVIEWPTVVELQKKAELLHKDITNHWIDRELRLLPKRIDWANEKGYRVMVQDYCALRKKLKTPSEVSLLLDTLPKVIPDTSESESNPEDVKHDVKRDDISLKSICRRDSAASGDGWQKKGTSEVKTRPEIVSPPEKSQSSAETYGPRKPQLGHTPNSDFEHKNTPTGGPLQLTAEEKMKKPELSPFCKESLTCSQETHLKQAPKINQMVDVIELPSDDEKDQDGNVSSVPKTNNKQSDMWCILGPNGESGKCNPSLLKLLNDMSNSSPNASQIKVWREDENEENAILLQEAMKIVFPKK